MSMQKAYLLALALLLAACHSPTPPRTSQYEGFWSDSTGVASFEVLKQGGSYQIKNSMGILQGTLIADKIIGHTEQGIPFSMVVRGDTAEYTVMDLTMRYQRIDQKQFEDLRKKTQP